LARRLKVISDPTRLAMLQALRWRAMTVSELATHFSLAQPTVSAHVKLLREAGVISNRIEGGQRKLVVQQEALNALLEHLGALFTAPDNP
jgi:DNA-binding transcriptional ArsR family regulator